MDIARALDELLK